MTTLSEHDTGTPTSAVGPGRSPALEFASAWDYAAAPETAGTPIAPSHGLYM